MNQYTFKTLKICTVLLLFNSAVSQTIKSYSGNFENGTATYQFYENEAFERVYHGVFNYKCKDFEVSGKFNHNKRDGIWKVIVLNQKCYGCGNSGNAYNEIVNAIYTDGKLNGACSYLKTDVKTKQTLRKSTANFKNDTQVGDFFFECKDGEDSFTIKMHLTPSGFLDSTYQVKIIKNGITFEHTQKYRNGYMYFELARNLSNGEVIRKSDFTKFFDQYFALRDTINKVSIISFLEFSNPSEIPGCVKDYTQKINSKLSISNIPVCARREKISEDYNSNWEVANCIDFWAHGNVSNGGAERNPLYFFDRGANKVDFLPVKQPFVDSKEYDNIKKNLSLKVLLNAIDSSIVWQKVNGGIFKKDSIQNISVPSFYISSLPLTKSQGSGFVIYQLFKKNNYSMGPVHECAAKIRSNVSEKTYIDHIYLTFSTETDDRLTGSEIVQLFKSLGYRKASLDEIKYAKTLGYDLPMTKNRDGELNYFVKSAL